MGNHRNHGISCLLCGYEKTVGRKLCKRCYYRERKKGTLENFPQATLADSFMNRVQKTDSCWLWTGTKNGYGYGIVLVDKLSKRAHRVSYEMFKGKIPDELIVLHSCDNPACVNPDHLSTGTKLDNNRDAMAKRRNAFGERNGHAKLSSDQVAFILQSDLKQVDLAKLLSVTQSHISRIKAGIHRKKG